MDCHYHQRMQRPSTPDFSTHPPVFIGGQCQVRKPEPKRLSSKVDSIVHYGFVIPGFDLNPPPQPFTAYYLVEGNITQICPSDISLTQIEYPSSSWQGDQPVKKRKYFRANQPDKPARVRKPSEAKKMVAKLKKRINGKFVKNS